MMDAGETSIVPTAADDIDAAANRTVLFDFDGVLLHGDAFYLFMRDRYAHSFLRKGLALLCAPWLLLLLPFSRRWAARALVHLALLGVGESRYRALARAFAGTLARRSRQFCRDGLHALRRHQAEGDRVIVVTGCEDTLVRGILAELGLAEVEVHASQLRAGWFGMRSRWHNVGRRKVQLLASHGITAWRLAYSDSAQDIPMLKVAAEPVLVNATPKLCKRVEKALGRSVARVEWY